MTFEWTPEHIKTLIALWNEGLTTSEIGARMGITKNAVVGKVHRLGLPKRGSPIKPKPEKKVEVKKILKLLMTKVDFLKKKLMKWLKMLKNLKKKMKK